MDKTKMAKSWNQCSCKFLYGWISFSIFLFSTDADSMRGQKITFFGKADSYVKLQHDMPANLCCFTLCLDLQRTSNTRKWTAFTYHTNRSGVAGCDPVQELGIGGIDNDLVIWLFGTDVKINMRIPLNIWHTICFTWSYSICHLSIYLNGTEIAYKHLKATCGKCLTPNGTLVLGQFHSWNNAIEIIDGRNFIGKLYFFQLWNNDAKSTVHLECSEGNIINWNTSYWKLVHLQATNDESLRCAIITRPTSLSTSTSATKNTTLSTSTATMVTGITSSEQPEASTYSGTKSSIATTTSPTVSTAPATITMVSTIHSMKTSAFAISATINPTYTAFSSSPAEASFFSAEVNIEIEHNPLSFYIHTAKEYVERWLHFIFNNTQHNVQDFTLEEKQARCSDLYMCDSGGGTTYNNLKKRDLSSTSMRKQKSTISNKKSITNLRTESTNDLNKESSGYTSKERTTSARNKSTDLGSQNNSISTKQSSTSTEKQSTTDSCKQNSTITIKQNSRISDAQSKGNKSTSSSYFSRIILLSMANTDKNRTIEDIITHLNTSYSESRPPTFVKALFPVNVSKIEPGDCPVNTTYSTDKGIYTWGRTKPEKNTEKPCIWNDAQFANRTCSIDAATGNAKWNAPNLARCKSMTQRPEKIYELQNVNVTLDNAADVAELILHLSVDTPTFSKEELDIIFSKINEILDISEVTVELADIILYIINDILSKNSSLGSSTNEILRITEKVGNKVGFHGESITVNASTVGLSLVKANLSHFQGLSFGVASYSEVAGPEIFINAPLTDGTVAYISLPQSLQIPLDEYMENFARFQFHFYGQTSLFEDYNLGNEIINTYVVAASLTNETIENLTDPIRIKLKHMMPNMKKENVSCVFWDFHQNDGLGGWSRSGCEVESTTVFYTNCCCNHLTHFGVLLDISQTPIEEKDETILTIITYIGCGISCLFLGVILVTYIAFEKLRRDYPSKILMNLCSALLLLNIVFLVNSWLASFKTPSLCISVAVLLHFFLLASFTWMGLEAVHMYFALVKVFNTYIRNYIIKFCIAGWGIPAIIVAIVLVINTDFYGSSLSSKKTSTSGLITDFCWIQNDVVFYVTVVTYFTIIFLMNLAMFIAVLIQINRMTSKKQHSWKTGFFHDLKSSASLTFLLGLTWGFAFFAWGPVKVPFLYLFSIANPLQGFFIFVFQCMMKENVIKQWRIHLCCGRFRLNEYTEWTRSASNAKSKHQSLAKKSPEESRKSIKSNSTSSTSNASVSEKTLAYKVSLEEDHLYDNQAFMSSTYAMNMITSTQRISAKEVQNYCGNRLDVPTSLNK